MRKRVEGVVKAQCMVNTEMWDILPAWDSPWQTWTSLITNVFILLPAVFLCCCCCCCCCCFSPLAQPRAHVQLAIFYPGTFVPIAVEVQISIIIM